MLKIATKRSKNNDRKVWIRIFILRFKIFLSNWILIFTDNSSLISLWKSPAENFKFFSFLILPISYLRSVGSEFGINVQNYHTFLIFKFIVLTSSFDSHTLWISLCKLKFEVNEVKSQFIGNDFDSSYKSDSNFYLVWLYHLNLFLSPFLSVGYFKYIYMKILNNGNYLQ